MPPQADIDRLVARAQRGDALALEAVCARVRPMLLRHARRLLGRSADVEDAVQDVLIVACARIATYRWEGSFAGWLYAIATRSILRRALATPHDATLAVDLADRALVADHDPMTEAEWGLVEQDLHLACTLGVLTALSSDA
ncbi:MAG TPA: sigma-70 family RNA polymerase sigma factor, partial [Solirubrobacteraceae bacterium]|nr:sigma-70 family RNA polymerase sigma factor [Solirubrobacteraceae bacterium]